MKVIDVSKPGDTANKRKRFKVTEVPESAEAIQVANGPDIPQHGSQADGYGYACSRQAWRSQGVEDFWTVVVEYRDTPPEPEESK